MSLRHNWTKEEVSTLFDRPFNDLIFEAQQLHRQHFDPNKVQISTLMSIKTGRCSEDCSYCSQSAHYETALEAEQLVDVETVVAAAKEAQAKGAQRFCMGAAWARPNRRDFPKVVEMVKAVKALGMESCMTLGMLDDEQVQALQQAGLDYYNHNLDTSPEYYEKIITTRTYQDRLDTIARVQASGIHVCSGGILGMGESRDDRIALLLQLANMRQHPQSVPINMLVPIAGTPLAEVRPIDPLEFVKTIAVARIMMPASWVRLSAGRESMSDEMQALCFLAGANSLFYGDKLLTTENAGTDHDQQLFAKLGLNRVQ